MPHYADGLKEYGVEKRKDYSLTRYKCDKGHVVTTICGFGWKDDPYRCPVCIGMKPSAAENLRDLNEKLKKERKLK